MEKILIQLFMYQTRICVLMIIMLVFAVVLKRLADVRAGFIATTGKRLRVE